MAADIPFGEPATIVAGDSVSWKRSEHSYLPDDGWILRYALQKEAQDGETITFDSSADGSDHLISLDSATTQTWLAGAYAWRLFAINGLDRSTIDGGRLTVEPDFAGAPIDPRSKARRILDFIDRSWERLASKQTVSTTIDGEQFVFRSIEDMKMARDYWSTIVAAEEAAASGKARTSILARFTSPL